MASYSNTPQYYDSYEDRDGHVYEGRESPLFRQPRFGDTPTYRYPDQPLDSYRGAYTYEEIRPRQSLNENRYQHPAEQGAYLFIQFPARGGKDVDVAAQSCVLNKKCAEINHGRFLGIARRVGKFQRRMNREEITVQDKAILAYFFQSAAKARLFFISDKRFKQHDFPPPSGYCEAWSVCRYYNPDREDMYNTFMMSEIKLQPGVTHREYKEKYCTPFAQLLLDYDAQPFVVQANQMDFLRQHFTSSGTITTIHLFMSTHHLDKVMDDDRYLTLRRRHADLATEDCSIFTVDPHPCP